MTSKLRNGDQGLRQHAAGVRRDARAGSAWTRSTCTSSTGPTRRPGLWQDSWRAMERLRDEGRVRAVGRVQLPRRAPATSWPASPTRCPRSTRSSCTPRFQQADLVAACRAHGIAVEAYSPLGQGADLEDPRVTGDRRRARRHPGAGDPALARRQGPRRDPQVRLGRAHAGQRLARGRVT